MKISPQVARTLRGLPIRKYLFNCNTKGEGEEGAYACHQSINLRQSVCQPKQDPRQYRANLKVASHALLIILNIYRPPGPAITLFSELQDILSYMSTLP